MRGRFAALGAASLLCLSACSDTAAPTDGVRFSLYLTDAPGDVRAWASFTEIYVQGGGGGRQALLSEPTELIELTALVGLVQELAAEGGIPLGTAGQIRAVIDQAVLEDGDGNAFGFGGAVHPEETPVTGELLCPSCTTTGIKIVMTGGSDDVSFDQSSASLLLDFDVAQSFDKASPHGGWVMHPVIMGTLTQSDGGSEAPIPTGMIQGNVQLPFFGFVPECPPGTPRDLSSFVPLATMAGMTDGSGNPIVRSGSTTAAGAFEIPFLDAGDYDLSQAATEFGTYRLVFSASVIPGSVSLTDGGVANASYMIQTMACEPIL